MLPGVTWLARGAEGARRLVVDFVEEELEEKGTSSKREGISVLRWGFIGEVTGLLVGGVVTRAESGEDGIGALNVEGVELFSELYKES